MSRVFNFAAGPATLPEEVLKQAAEEMLDYRGSGMSVMEMSHRSAEFKDIIETAEADLRSLMGIPENYKVLFLQGGDSLIFASVFMNLARNGKADYIVTGNWSKKAFGEAKILGDAKKIADGSADNFSSIPDLSDLDIREDTSYVYICQNETVHGNRITTLPDTKGHILVSDQSSMFLSEPVNVSDFGLIHAGVQKNVGPAGVQIVIVREDLIAEDIPELPNMLRFKAHADNASLYDTPPCYGIYITGLVFKWIEKIGGLEAMKERNEKKAKLLYDVIDNSRIFKGTVVPKDRSIMNVDFVTGDDDLNAKFVSEAKAAGLVNLKGHRSVGGMRASIYNAMPVEGVEKLAQFMEDFDKANA